MQVILGFPSARHPSPGPLWIDLILRPILHDDLDFRVLGLQFLRNRDVSTDVKNETIFVPHSQIMELLLYQAGVSMEESFFAELLVGYGVP
jgi:hypothetical protein